MTPWLILSGVFALSLIYAISQFREDAAKKYRRQRELLKRIDHSERLLEELKNGSNARAAANVATRLADDRQELERLC